VKEQMLELYGSDPFSEVVRRAEAHRELHGPRCGLYPAGPHVMGLVAMIVRASRPQRMLGLGRGCPYGIPRRDWSEFAGPRWARATIAYARDLARDARLHITWSISPPLGLAVKRPTAL
jgi:hypothetical protein